MSSRKVQKPGHKAGEPGRVELLEQRVSLLEHVFRREVDRELYRRDEIARKAREDQEWQDGLPQRVEAFP